MKRLALLLTLIFALSGCTTRTAPVLANVPEESPVEQSDVSLDLKPLSESSIGQALLGCVREVNSVTITATDSEEVVYESSDDVLSQSFYDAVQIVHENLDAVDTVLHDYQVEFDTALGIRKSYSIWMSDNVIVQNEDKIWTLPQSESDWLRSRIKGLA